MNITAGLPTGLGNEGGLNPEQERQNLFMRQQREEAYKNYIENRREVPWQNPNQIVWPQGDGQQSKGGSPYEHTPGYDEGWPPKAPQKTPTPAPQPNVQLAGANLFGGSNLSNAVGNMNDQNIAGAPRYIQSGPPPNVINKAPHIDSRYMDRLLEERQRLNPGVSLPPFV